MKSFQSEKMPTDNLFCRWIVNPLTPDSTGLISNPKINSGLIMKTSAATPLYHSQAEMFATFRRKHSPTFKQLLFHPPHKPSITDTAAYKNWSASHEADDYKYEDTVYARMKKTEKSRRFFLVAFLALAFVLNLFILFSFVLR